MQLMHELWSWTLRSEWEWESECVCVCVCVYWYSVLVFQNEAVEEKSILCWLSCFCEYVPMCLSRKKWVRGCMFVTWSYLGSKYKSQCYSLPLQVWKSTAAKSLWARQNDVQQVLVHVSVCGSCYWRWSSL